MRKTPYKTWILAGLFLLMPWVAHAAGLGKLTILSALGQPLLAEVDLVSVQTGELATLVARLAPPEAFTQANIAYSLALIGVRMSFERRADGQPYIKIISMRPVNEPFINLLVELSWAQGRLVREYTALIDPIGYTPAVSVAPVEPSVAVTAPVTSEPQPIAPAPQPPVAAAVPAETKPAAGQARPVKPPVAAAAEAATKAYGPVKRGDTLSKIAASVKPEGVTLEQMLVGLYHANPEAFAGNMNHLKTGKILRVPEKERVVATGQSEAVKEMRVEAANWQAYRQKLAEAAGETQAREPKSAASGKITAKVDDKAAGKAAPKEVLKLSKGEPAAGKASPKDASRSIAKRMHTLEEEAIAREKALADANNRIAQLEKTIKNMQSILEITGQVPATKPSPRPAPPANGETAKTEPAKAPGEAPKSQPQATPAENPVVAEPPKPKPKPKPKVVVTPPTPDLIELIAGEPAYLVAVLALVGLGGGYLFVRRRRAQAGSDEPTDEKIEPEIGKKIAAVGGGVLALLSGYLSARRGARASAGDAARERIAPELGQKAAATAATTAAAEPPALAVPAAGGEEDVDPLAEADMYLNFGRDVQAEEVLIDALEKTPNNEDVKLKLLQVYAGRKDKAAFEKIAHTLRAQTKGEGDNWVKAAAMGYAFDPMNALYEAGRLAPAATPIVGGVGPDLDFNFELDAASTARVANANLSNAPTAEADKTAGMQPGEIAGAAVTQPPAEPDVTVDVPADETVITEVTGDAAAPMSNVIDFSFDAMAPVQAPVNSAAAEKPAEAAGNGMPMLEPDFKLDLGGSEAAVPLAPEFRLDDINLNFDEGPTAEIPQAENGARDDHWYDVQTKFDLAKAYQEMGDRGGAREILQEVIKEGDAGQQGEAQKLLASLG